MTERSRREDSRDPWIASAAPAARPPTTRPALWAAFAGHLLLVIAAATDRLAMNLAIVAALACSIIAVAALMERADPAARARRVVTALIGGHGAAVAILVTGFAPSVPAVLPRAGLAAAAALGVAGLVAIGRASTDLRPPRPLARAPQVAAIALVAQALVQPWVASASGLSMAMHAAVFVALAALGVALLASVSIIALRVRRRWALASLLAWTLGWAASSADLSSLLAWSLGGSFPVGPHQLRALDAELVQILATAGGLALGSAVAASIHDVRVRHSAVVLLAGYAVFGLLAAVAEHRIELATDFPGITVLSRNRDLSAAIRAFALAGVMWLGWRQAAAALPRATSRRRDRA